MPNEENSERVSFNDAIQDAKTQKNIKIDGAKSRFAKKEEKTENTFEARAKEVHQKLEGHNAQAVELGKKFLQVIDQRILPENKGPIEKSFEREILKDLVAFAIVVNNDENEPRDCMGSVALLTLLLNVALRLKDRNSALEYKVTQLEREVGSLKKEMSSLGEKVVQAK